MFTLNEIESKYREAIESVIKSGKPLTAKLLVDMSKKLYNELKVEDVGSEADGDMLLYQYGVYNWHDEHGEHFSLDITRQFIPPSTYEPYQLSFALIFDPAPFQSTGFYDCWYPDYGDLDSFIAHIKSTDGFKAAENHAPKTYSIQFNQC